MKNLVISGFIGFGLLATPLVLSAQDDMQRAIQWEHYKDAAAARQAALERQHKSVPDRAPALSTSNTADRSADREDNSGIGSRAAFRTEPTAAEVAQAVAWEHHKDAAAARQAAAERNTNADRSKQ